jgi:hypothetical protein
LDTSTYVIGIKGNGIADEQASFAITNSDTPLIEQICYDDSKKYNKEIINNKWQYIWSKQSTKLNEIKRDAYRWHNPNLKRKEETLIHKLRIRHTRITRSFLMAKEDLPICTPCGIKLSVKQIIVECLKYNQDMIGHKISHNLDAAIGPIYQNNID